MLRFLAARLALAVPTLIAISLLVFFAGYLSPGDPVDVILDQRASPEAKARVRHSYGLDQPPLTRYTSYVWGIVSRGDFGRSFFNNGEPVVDIIRRGLPSTALLAVSALFLSLAVGIPLGILAAVWANRTLDRVAMGIALAGVAIPSFVLGPVLVLLFTLRLGWLPSTGFSPQGRMGPEYFLLPSVVLAARSAALITRLTRSAMLDVLRQDYIRTARAKGLGTGAVLFKHALKNAFPPILTVAGTTFGYLLSGSFVVETFFNIPGIGNQSIASILRRDYPVIQGMALLLAATFVLVNLVVDILYGVLDPRARIIGARVGAAARLPRGAG
jgi:peptide/nickel transport system permease protein